MTERWTTPNEDIWTTASRIGIINKEEESSTGVYPRSSNNNSNNYSSQQVQAKQEEQVVVEEVRKENIDDEIALHSTSGKKQSIHKY